jgi:hypothetical protein
MAITSQGLNDFANGIMAKINDGAVIKDGVTQATPIYKWEVVGAELRVYLLFDQAFVGTLTKFQLRNVSGQVLVDQPDNIAKIANKLLLVTFKFTLSERMVV